MTELVRAQGRVAFWKTLLMWRVARACQQKCVAPRVTGDGTVTDSRSPVLLRPPQGVESESHPECRDLLGVANMRFLPKNRGSMMVRLGGLGPSAYPRHPHKSVGFGLRKGPWKKTPFRRPHGFH